ncbi:MAG: hypothetical protein DRI83_00680, partial [Bacteroidetes bacterium]
MLNQFGFAQNNANIWYFGDYAGMDFNSGAPIALTNSAMSQHEGCATISDNFGNLLFYTNGMTIWNASHTIMPNGSGLMGHVSSAQSGIIVPKPGDPDIYYVFTVPSEIGATGLRYSEVDMTLQGGLGDVTAVKNIFLTGPTEEKVTAVRHTNNYDVWVITHLWDSDEFHAYLITASGVNTTSVVTSVGSYHSGVQGYTHSCMKFSPDGAKLAIVTRHQNSFELFDFDASTGIVSNPITYPSFYNSGYGIEFSPDGSLIYMSKYGGATEVYQFSIPSSPPGSAGTLIGTVNNTHVGSMQLAPDGKIYVASLEGSTPVSDPYLGVIEFPNTVGLGCNYIDDGFFLDGGGSRYGLPTFIQSYLFGQVTADDVCDGDSVYFFLNYSGVIDSVRWDFGDPASGGENTSALIDPTHLYTSTGVFNYNVIVYSAITVDTIYNSVQVFVNPITDLGNDTTICSGNSVTFDAGPGFDSYLWHTGATSQTITANTQGWYWVEVSSGICTGIDSVYLTVVFNAVAEAGSNESICQGSFWDFNNSSILPIAASYDSIRWTGGLGSFDDPTQIRPTYYSDASEVGPVVLTLNAYGIPPCGNSSDDMTLTINANPSCDFTMTPSDTVCIDEQVLFEGSGSPDIMVWIWNFGDGNNATGQNVTHSFANPGVYDVRLVATNANICTDTIIHQKIVINPIIDFTITLEPSCENDTVFFSASGNYGFSSWEWDFGDGNTAFGKNIWHIYNSSGFYTITLNYCGQTVVHTHEVLEPPSVNAGSDETVCEHYPFDFGTAAVPATALNYDSVRWFGGLGSFSNPNDVLPIYTPALGELGVIDFMLVAYAILPCSNDTSYVQLTIFDGPEADFTITPGDS